MCIEKRPPWQTRALKTTPFPAGHHRKKPFVGREPYKPLCVAGLSAGGRSMPTSEYFRRQADLCLRLSLIASDEVVSDSSNRHEPGLPSESRCALPTGGSGHRCPRDFAGSRHTRSITGMWLGLTAIVLAASIGFTVLAIVVQRFPPPERLSPPWRWLRLGAI